MRINGFTVLMNEKEWKSWAKRFYLYPCEKPKEYPCIPDTRIGADENPYPDYEYLSLVRARHNALLKASGKRGQIASKAYVTGLENIFRWLLGMRGDFKERGEKDGAYWWRTELSQRWNALAKRHGIG